MTKFRVVVRTDTTVEVEAVDEEAAEEAAIARVGKPNVASNTEPDIYVLDIEKLG